MNHLPIRVSTLRGDQKISFNAYIKINDKFILYLRQGDSFEGLRLERLKEKKLKKMFILPEHENSYLDYLNRNIEMAYDNQSRPLEVRAEIVQGAQQANAEEVMENPGDAAAYSEAKSAAEKFVEFLNREDQALSHILKIENPDANIAHHGVTVSSLAVGVAKRLSLFEGKQLQLLSLGALLHDFEHFHNELDLKKNPDQFSLEQKLIYEKHPTDGSDKVQGKSHFDEAVIRIIAQHEETVDGSGFPRHLTESQSDPLAVLVSTCNALDRLISFESMAKKEAIKHLLISRVGKHPLNQIQTLGDIINS